MAAVSAMKIKKSCSEVSQLLKALSHPRRLTILGNLLEGPKTVSQLTTCCNGTQPQISHFLTRMKFEGLVQSKREGKYVVYAVADRRLAALMKVIQNEYC